MRIVPRRAELDGPRLDLIAAIVLVLAIVLELRSYVDPRELSGVVTAVAAVLYAAPIAVRRHWPAGALLVCSVVAATEASLGGHLGAANGSMVPPVLLAYGTGAWLPARRGLAALVLAAVIFSGFALTSPTPSSLGGAAADAFFVSLFFLVPWFIGLLAREPSRRARAFHELAEQAAAENRQRELAAIAEERARIGGELQDIIAHSVSAMIIQAGGARRLMARDPERARGSILHVEQTGREALADLRRLLGMLRHDDDPRALAPQPGLGQLEVLVRSLRDEGLTCDLRREGGAVDLTPGIDLVGYRVVEATLGAAVRHRGGRADVGVRFSPGWLELEIRGDRAIPALEQELAGIAERVALYDGSLRARAVGAKGFAVSAMLPLAAAEA